MSRYRTVLERERERYVLPRDALENLRRRRDRRRRNQRILSAVLALVLAGAAIGSAVVAFRGSERQLPAERITPENVSRLRLAWWAETTGPTTLPVVADGVVFAGTSAKIYAFPARCGSSGRTCEPLWSGNTGPIGTPALGDGVIYAAGSIPGGKLYGFPAFCGSGGIACEPLWTGRFGGLYGHAAPVVANGVVYVGSYAGKVYAFPADCGTGGIDCEPMWVASVGVERAVDPLAAADGLVYVGTVMAATARPLREPGTLYAFPSGCDRGCRPLWRLRLHGPILGLAAADGRLYVGTSGEVYAFPSPCYAPGGCAPLWTGETRGPAIGMAFTDSTIYVQGEGLYAFPTACRTDGGVCDPRWVSAEALGPFSSGPPAFSEGLVYVGTQDGIHAFPASCSDPCDPIWTEHTGLLGWVDVAVGEGMVYAAWEGGLSAFAPSKAPRDLSPPEGRLTALFYAALAGLTGLFLMVRRARSRRIAG
ncbi:MAG: PQQ-like beta-propeller repeat protein [Actinobacteria bacterium]|nr:PQQ-like beta-propeller repeat protein [Actinomycetota bacterium]